MTPIRDRSPHPKRWEEFLKAFTARVAKPTSFLLSVRCITRQTLSGIFSEIQQELNLPSTFPSGVAIIEHLISMGFASRIPVEGSAGTAPSKEFILLGIQESQDLDTDPLELLQAYDQQGTICYFSALAYFNLTNQVPVHHHVATLTNQGTPNTNAERPATIVNPKKTNTKSRLGTYLFTYEGGTLLLHKEGQKFDPGNQDKGDLSPNQPEDNHNRTNLAGYPAISFSLWRTRSRFRSLGTAYRTNRRRFAPRLPEDDTN